MGYLFARYALSAGYPVRRIGLYAEGGANDLMVEVKMNGNWTLFTPSAGTYYPFGLGELLLNPIKASNYIGQPRSAGGAYLSEVFFARLLEIKIYRSLNNFGQYLRERNLAESAHVDASGFFPSPNDASAAIQSVEGAYAAGMDGGVWVIILKWDLPVVIYRLFIRWLSPK